MKKQVKPKEIETTPNCKVSIKIAGRVYTAEGVDAKEAISKLDPLNKKGMAVLTVEQNGKSREVIIPASQTFKIFNGGRLMKEVALKNISMRFT